VLRISTVPPNFPKIRVSAQNFAFLDKYFPTDFLTIQQLKIYGGNSTPTATLLNKVNAPTLTAECRMKHTSDILRYAKLDSP